MLGALEVRTGEGNSPRSAVPGSARCQKPSSNPARPAGQVLAACPQVCILATSREPLAVTGEALWTVGPLTMRRIPP